MWASKSKTLFITVTACLWAVWLSGSGNPAPQGQQETEASSLIREPNYIQHTWSSRDGLPHKTIYCIASDPQGNLLLGSDTGIIRFDGVSFKKLEVIYPEMELLANTRITSMLVSRDKDLWIGSYGKGLAVLRNQGRNLRVFSTLNNFPNNFIPSLCEDSAKNIWAGTMGGGLICIGKNSMTHYTTRSRLSHNTITALLPGENGSVWIGTEKGLNLLMNKTTLIFTNREGLPGNRITALFKDRWNGIWVGGAAGVCRIVSSRMTPSASPQYYFQNFPILDGEMVTSIVHDIYGGVWLATSRGLFHAPPFGRNVEARLEPFISDSLFFKTSLLSLHQDRESIIWAGGAGSGLGSLFREKAASFATRQGLSNANVTAIFQDRDGDIWLGTAGGGLNRIHNGTVTIFNTRNGLLSNFIRALTQDNTGDIWVGTQEGLNRLRGNRFIAFSSRDGLSEDCINALFADSRGRLWIATHGGGLNRFKNNKFEILSTADGLSDNYVLSLAGDIYGTIWAGTNSGLNRISEDYLEHFTGKSQLAQVTISDLYLDGRGRLWIATLGNGLFHYYRDWLTHFPKPRELASGSFYRILDNPGANQLWLSSSNGVLVAARDTLESFSSGLDDEAPFFILNDSHLSTAAFSGGFQPAGWRMNNGVIWLPSSAGAVLISPEQSIPKSPSASLQIDRVLVDDVPTNLGAPGFQPRVKRRIEVEFGAPEFKAPANIRFRYKLTGSKSMLFSPTIYDREWQVPPLGNRLVFKDLPSGFYYLEIVAANPSGVFNYDEVTTLSFIMREPFYETFPFIVSFFLTGLAVFFFITRRLHRRSRSGENFSLFPHDDKYKTFSLPMKKARQYRARVLEFMEKEKPYLDPEITMPKLAEMMDMSKEELSYVVNKELRLNFNAFLNEYRIREAKERLRDPRENRYVILKIAHDVGFNSKSSFNLVFKNLTGLSPSEYRKKHQPPTTPPPKDEND